MPVHSFVVKIAVPFTSGGFTTIIQVSEIIKIVPTLASIARQALYSSNTL